MEYMELKEILNLVNNDKDFSKDDVIKKIKERLKAKYENKYKNWEEAGFNIDHLFTKMQMTLLHFAVENGNTKVVNALIDKGANVNAKDKNGYTPLHEAAFYGYVEIVNVLIKKGADVNAKDKNVYTPLHAALHSSKINNDVVKALLEKDASGVDAKGKNGHTPLHLAASKDYKETAKILLDKGADVSTLGNGLVGQTILCIAAENGYAEIVKTYPFRGVV